MKTNPIVVFAFYISITISAFSVLFWFGLGMREWLGVINEVLHPYMQANDNGIPLWLIEVGYFLAILALGLLIAFLILYFALGKILEVFVRPDGEYFDRETSIETRIYRGNDGVWYSACTKLTFVLSFLFAFWLLRHHYSTLYLCGVMLSFGVYALFQGFLIYCGVVEADITHTYHFKTKPGYDFYIQHLGNGWTDKAKNLFAEIDKQSTDYQVALQLRALSLGEKGPDKPYYDYIGGGDPSIQYGPATEEDRKKWDEQYNAYEASETRVG